MNIDPQNLRFWSAPVKSIEQFIGDAKSLRAEKLTWTGSSPTQRAAFLHLMQIVRHRSLIEHLIKLHVKRPPKPKLQALLSLAIIQMLEDPGDTGSHAKCIHHTVNITRQLCSTKEAGFLNAVCRSISRSLNETLTKLDQNPQTWHIRYSHPEWLVERWLNQHGNPSTQNLLRWNQQIPTTYAHDVFDTITDSSAKTEADLSLWEINPKELETTKWHGFYSLKHSDKTTVDRLMQKPIYIQDPSTAIAPSLFSNTARPKRVLDACAAPGGKCVHLFKHFREMDYAPEEWVATDSNQKRLTRFLANMNRLGVQGIQTLEADWENGIPTAFENSQTFDWIIIDAPCSSVGVIQRHPEIRWRLQPDDYEQLPLIQSKLLANCARLLGAGGELVYSTCSFDPQENAEVVKAFLDSDAGRSFELSREIVVLPHEKGHDGVGAYLLKKVK